MNTCRWSYGGDITEIGKLLKMALKGINTVVFFKYKTDFLLTTHKYMYQKKIGQQRY